MNKTYAYGQRSNNDKMVFCNLCYATDTTYFEIKRTLTLRLLRCFKTRQKIVFIFTCYHITWAVYIAWMISLSTFRGLCSAAWIWYFVFLPQFLVFPPITLLPIFPRFVALWRDNPTTLKSKNEMREFSFFGLKIILLKF